MAVGTTCPTVAEKSATLVTSPCDDIFTNSPVLGSSTNRSSPTSIKLYQVPSGSKSAGGLATGWPSRYSLRCTTTSQVLSEWTLIMPLGTDATPCVQPAPESSPYKWWPTKATSPTTLTSPDSSILDGILSATVVSFPPPLTFRILAPVVLPV